MEISLRLEKIAQNVAGNTLLDIGTDHAYIPIYLCQREKIKNAIACDISKGSVDKAMENVKKYNLEKFICVKQSDGFKNIKISLNIDNVIIAGMGGMLIINILGNRGNIVNNNTNLILQPQKDIPSVRKYLHSEGFCIQKEEMFIDSNKYYNIIVAKKGNEAKYSENEYIFGKILIQNKCKVLKKYVLKELKRLEKLIKKVENLNSENGKNKVQKEYDLHKEVLKCL